VRGRQFVRPDLGGWKLPDLNLKGNFGVESIYLLIPKSKGINL
jgi:hypothetical protein